MKTKKKPSNSTSKKQIKKTRPAKKSDGQIGIFGGSFNPFHLGHLNSLLAVRKEFGLKEIRVVPSFRSPGKPEIETPSAGQRLEMVKLGIRDYRDFLVVDDREIQRGGESFSIETIHELVKENPKTNFALIMGADLLQSFNSWKSFEEILSLTDLIVTSRPGALLPFKKDDLPAWAQVMVADMNRERIVLTTGKSIRYFQLQDKEISGTEIRKSIRSGLRVDKYLSLPVEKYIKENDFYRPSRHNQLDFKQMTNFVADVLFDKKGFNVKGYDLSRCQAPSEFAIIASGTSTRHVGSLADSVHIEIKKKFGLNPLSVEGVAEGRWALIDFGGLIVHVFYDFVRQEYKLEELWRDKIDLHLKDTTALSNMTFQS